MDPLSITASIIALLEATSTVISLCSKYPKAASTASRIVEETKSLCNVLELLKKLAKKADKSQFVALRLLHEPDGGLLALCLVQLKTLERKLAPSSSKKSRLRQVVLWPLTEKDTNETLQTIERIKATLTLAITSDET